VGKRTGLVLGSDVASMDALCTAERAAAAQYGAVLPRGNPGAVEEPQTIRLTFPGQPVSLWRRC